MSKIWADMKHLTPYEVHKLIINEYYLRKPGDTALLRRDTSRDRNDYDILRENHRFLWDDDDKPDSWERQFAKKYYDKLFKEYCIGDLRLYKENKIALRWRTEKEVIDGKGQFICGNKNCSEEERLKTWEVNFAYVEDDIKKNALVKIRLCEECSKKLNYRSKKREVKRLHKSPRTSVKKRRSNEAPSTSTSIMDDTTSTSEEMQEGVSKDVEESPWEHQAPPEVKSREAEMEDYLNDLLL